MKEDFEKIKKNENFKLYLKKCIFFFEINILRIIIFLKQEEYY
jgi:hypothetical protein